MAYYHDLITEKSFAALLEFRRKYRFILIGGWAVYLYAEALKSRDIDFICDYEELEKLKKNYALVKNDRLKKYEIHMGEFDGDIYIPFFSDLGLPVEDLSLLTRSINGFTVLKPEALLILKQKAHFDRSHSVKGEKDKLDIIALIPNVDFKKYGALLKKYNVEYYKKSLAVLLKETREAPELDLNAHAFAQWKKKVLRNL